MAKQIGFSLLTGVGVGLTLQPSLIAIQGAVPRKTMAVVTATRNFVRNLGGAIGLALCGTVVSLYLRSEPNDPLRANQRGFRTVFLILASLGPQDWSPPRCFLSSRASKDTTMSCCASRPSMNFNRGNKEKDRLSRQPGGATAATVVSRTGALDMRAAPFTSCNLNSGPCVSCRLASSFAFVRTSQQTFRDPSSCNS